WHNLAVPALAAALCAAVLPLAGVRDIWANVGFAVCTFTAGAIFYELWRGMLVRHRHGEAYPLALYMLIKRYRQRYGGYIVHLGKQPASQISITTVGLTDVYVLLADWNGASEATIRVFINPLTSLVWYGGALMLIGGVICWWPERRRKAIQINSEMPGIPGVA